MIDQLDLRVTDNDIIVYADGDCVVTIAKDGKTWRASEPGWVVQTCDIYDRFDKIMRKGFEITHDKERVIIYEEVDGKMCACRIDETRKMGNA
jgi:hypothetical protein